MTKITLFICIILIIYCVLLIQSESRSIFRNKREARLQKRDYDSDSNESYSDDTDYFYGLSNQTYDFLYYFNDNQTNETIDYDSGTK